MVTAVFKVEAIFAGTTWADITADVRAAGGIHAELGMSGNAPDDRMAAPGILTAALDNTTQNAGGVLGYYSPRHANCRTGWTPGVRIRLTVSVSGGAYVCLWTGRVRTIQPDVGQYGPRMAHVFASDFFDDMLATSGRDIAVRLNGSAATCIGDCRDIMPTATKPASFAGAGAALDLYPYALDDATDDSTVYGLIKNVVLSSWGLLFCDPNLAYGDGGGMVLLGRDNLVTATSVHTFIDTEILERGPDSFAVPYSQDRAYNRVRVTISPPRADAAATTVLYALPENADSAIYLNPGGTVTQWINYTNPDVAGRLIGATNVVTAPVSGVDYLANSIASGSGVDYSASVGVVVTPFASTAKVTFTNGAPTGVYITKLEILGQGLYRDADITAESYASASFGDHKFEVELKYQDDALLAQDLADYLRAQYSTLTTQADWITFNPRQTAALASLACQPVGTVVTISETMSGVSAQDFMVVGFEHDITETEWTCRLRLAPAASLGQAWVLDDPVFSVLDDTTVLSYF